MRVEELTDTVCMVGEHQLAQIGKGLALLSLARSEPANEITSYCVEVGNHTTVTLRGKLDWHRVETRGTMLYLAAHDALVRWSREQVRQEWGRKDVDDFNRHVRVGTYVKHVELGELMTSSYAHGDGMVRVTNRHGRDREPRVDAPVKLSDLRPVLLFCTERHLDTESCESWYRRTLGKERTVVRSYDGGDWVGHLTDDGFTLVTACDGDYAYLGDSLPKADGRVCYRCEREGDLTACEHCRQLFCQTCGREHENPSDGSLSCQQARTR